MASHLEAPVARSEAAIAAGAHLATQLLTATDVTICSIVGLGTLSVCLSTVRETVESHY